MGNKTNSARVAGASLQPLFPEPGGEAVAILKNLPEILAQVWPLSAAHRRSLPHDIERLSRMLTCERGEIKKSYWASPANVSAYLYYFLPWNLIRFIRLLNGLELEAPEENPLTPALWDAGSGPLTAPLALWIARPQWRKNPLAIHALDVSRQPLELGKKLLFALADYCGARPWRVYLNSAPLPDLGRLILASKDSWPWLICSANVLNELVQKRRLRFSSYSPEEEEGEELPYERLLATWAQALRERSQLLFIEPGARMGGEMIMRIRERALEMGLTPAAPCTHEKECPLLQRSGSGKGSMSSSWCHFTFAAPEAPKWLLKLSKEAGLTKKALSLSCILLKGAKNCKQNTEDLPLRILSRAFPIPELGQRRYGCTPLGLALTSSPYPNGSLIYARKPQEIKRDAKSGAIILE